MKLEIGTHSVTSSGRPSCRLGDPSRPKRLRKLRIRSACPVGLVPGCVPALRRAGGGSRAALRAGPLAALRRWGRRYPASDSWIRTWTPLSGGWGPPQPSNIAPVRLCFSPLRSHRYQRTATACITQSLGVDAGQDRACCANLCH
jgi:hypothetical protein